MSIEYNAWTDEEITKLFRLRDKMNLGWLQIYHKFPNRTEASIRAKYNRGLPKSISEKRRYCKWNGVEITILKQMWRNATVPWSQSETMEAIAKKLGRTKSGVSARLYQDNIMHEFNIDTLDFEPTKQKTDKIYQNTKPSINNSDTDKISILLDKIIKENKELNEFMEELIKLMERYNE